MTCYKNNKSECWGTEWPVSLSGNLVTACSAHKDGGVKKPVIRVDILDQVRYDVFEEYLEPFIAEEIGEVEGVEIYGGPMAGLFAFKHKIKRATETPEPTHLFVVWDFEDEETFKMLDGMLDRGVVINSLVL